MGIEVGALAIIRTTTHSESGGREGVEGNQTNEEEEGEDGQQTAI